MIEKKIISNTGRLIYEDGCGTHKYDVTWQGDWSAKELIDYCNGGSSNFGGRIDNLQVKDLENKIFEGRVCVYYD